MNHTTPKERFWRRALRWVLLAVVVLLVVWKVQEARLRRQRTQALIRDIEALDGLVETRVPGWVDEVHAWLDFLPLNSRMQIINADEELFQTPTYIDLDDTSVDDAVLARLTGLANLQVLYLAATQVTDAGLAHLSGLRNLEELGLGDTQVTDAGLAHLSGLRSLEDLSLAGTQVTDAGLAHLSGLANLQLLYLSDTQVTDAGLAHLRGLRNLRWLGLGDTQVSDAGLVRLSGLTNLRRLDLRETQVTAAGVNELQQALPHASIEWDDPAAPRR